VACLVLSGCAHNTFSVSSMPQKYAAQSVSDYSSLNLTAYARPAPSAQEIRGGDRLAVALHTGGGVEGKEAIEEWTVGVDDQGNATLPNIGPIRLAGLTRAQAEREITHESIHRDVYLTPAVDLTIKERRRNSVMVIGGIGQPGDLEFPESSLTLADVIVRAGGLTVSATGHITVNRAESSWDGGDMLTASSHTTDVGDSLRINLATTSAAEVAAIQIPAGATVTVEESPGRSIRVIGVIADREVEVPAGRNVRLLDALALAGGPSYSNWISNRVDIIRRIPGKDETIRIRASIRKAKKDDKQNVLLAPNDIVSVEENLVTFTLSTLGGLSGLTNAARAATVP
jgi:protein involved in polysaccharide export with SLBB domain